MSEPHQHICAACGTQTDVNKYAFAWCAICNKNYCFRGTNGWECFLKDHRDGQCPGTFSAICNPQFIVNLKKQGQL